MKKKILCFMLAVLTLLTTLPLSVFASEIARAVDNGSTPVVSVSSRYAYDKDNILNEYRALPDNDGVFYFIISLSNYPETFTDDVVVYYRTVDDSAVAKWGDYEGVGNDASVTLSKSSGYTATVTVNSQIIENGFYTDGANGKANREKLVTRRFIFELIDASDGVRLNSPSSLYCYLRAKNYSYQSRFASHNTNIWKSSMRDVFLNKRETLLDYYSQSDPAWGPFHNEAFIDETNRIWAEGTANVAYDSWYYSIDSASYLNTPRITYGGTYTDDINLKFNEEWYNYVLAGVGDLGISINGSIISQFWDSTGDATFTLYYTHEGKTKKALTLYLEGEFDDSNFFGWEHAFEYAIEGLTGNNRDDHMDENFIGFTLYDNDENVVHEVKAKSRSELDEIVLCEDLKGTIKKNYAVELMAEYNEKTKYNDNYTAYYLKLPSDFALADSYSYELVLEKARESEIRWLENVKLTFALINSKEPMIAGNGTDSEMVTTNLETLKEGDPIRMSVRFDRPVFAHNPNNNVYITADVYDNKGVCLASDVRLYLKQLEGSYYYHAWDTLVFESKAGEFPKGIEEGQIASLRNIKIVDNDTNIKSFFTKLPLKGLSINDIYISRDLRYPYATANPSSIDDWSKGKSVYIYVNVDGKPNIRFTDYVTVYYEWSDRADLNPEEVEYSNSSKVVLHTKADGNIRQSIRGSGNEEMYLYLKAVSSYGKTMYSGPFGSYKFDNSAPVMDKGYEGITEDFEKKTITVKVPEDNCGVDTMELYYVSDDGKEEKLETFKISSGQTEFSYEITHSMVEVGVDDKENKIPDRQEITFYWKVTDKLGHVSERTGEFKLLFDTHEYISDSVMLKKGPIDFTGDGAFIKKPETAGDRIYLYDYIDDKGQVIVKKDQSDEKTIYYSFGFEIDGAGITDDKKEYYDILVSYNGTALKNGYTVDRTVRTEEVVADGEDEPVQKEIWQITMQLYEKIESGRYEIVLTRSVDADNGSSQDSQVYTVYATANEDDNTEIRQKVESGTLLSNTVYQLSSEYPYFYYKDKDGAIQKEPYGGTKLPATFSSLEKAEEYVYYMELSDIYLVQLNTKTASALSSNTGGMVIADGETTEPRAEQYWIRYKSKAWTPTSGDSAWVYYYYGERAELIEGALSANLEDAVSTVANRIAGYGRTVVLTDTSLILGATSGDKMLDSYGMPYLDPAQIHISEEEESDKTKCGNIWREPVGFAADSNIYKSMVSVGIKGTTEYEECPIVGRFSLPENSIFQYMNYDQYNGSSPEWNTLNVEKGDSFIDALEGSGIFYIRELSSEGVSVYTIYIDRAAPDVSFFKTDENGGYTEIPFDEKDVPVIMTKDLYIGGIADYECDRLSYVAVYKMSSLSLVGVYTATELESGYVKLADGNYYIVVSDRSGNHYVLTAKVNNAAMDCDVKVTDNKHIKVTCNRRKDQIQRYEVYLNGELVTSTYEQDQTFTRAGNYYIIIQDIYGNELTPNEYELKRDFPEVTWKYYDLNGNIKTYDKNNTSADGFVMDKTPDTDNQYTVSTAVKTKFSISSEYGYEFIGTAPKHESMIGVETVVEIEEGQSFTLKVYYKSDKDCYTIYSGIVDVTPPSVNVSAELDVLKNGEYDLFNKWLSGGAVVMDDIYYVLTGINSRTVSNGDSVSSDNITINLSDVNGLSLVEVYLDGTLIETQDGKSEKISSSQITVNKWGKYRIVAKDILGNTSEFTFTNGMPDHFDYFVDGKECEQELHGYLNFKEVSDNKHVYTKLDFGNKEFRLDLKQNADVFMSVGVNGGTTEIYGFRISDGRIYPLAYQIANNSVDLVAGSAVLDLNAKDFKVGEEYLISKNGAYTVYASIALDKTVSIRVYAPQDPTKVVSVSARIEDTVGGNISFISAELSKKSSDVTLDKLGAQTNNDIRVNNGFKIDESTFDSERISSVRLYYSKLNDLDVNNLSGKTNIYVTDRTYSDEGFYLLIVRNHYGNERAYRISILKSFSVTSSVTFEDGQRIFYSKDYNGTLYSNSEITLDILDADVTVTATLNGAAYKGFAQKKEGGITYLVFSEAGKYTVKLTDSYGNVITRKLEIDKNAYSVPEELLTGYNEKALKRDEGYTNQKLSIDKTVYESAGIYYLAVQYGDKLNVLFDAFAENSSAISDSALINAIGADGDGVYKVICRNRYGAVVTKEIHYRGTPTLHLERTTRSQTEAEAYDLDYAISLGFWSNNTLSFSTDAKTYVFTVNGSATECPKNLVFENAGDFGSFEYVITYVDEYGFEYLFKAYLVRKNVTVDLSSDMEAIEIDGVLNTKNDVSVTFDDKVYATYTRNNGEETVYRSGEVLKKDGVYRFTVIDYAGNATSLTVKKDTAVEFSFIEAGSGNLIQSGSVVNSSRIDFKDLNKDGAYIEKYIYNGVVQKDFNGSDFNKNGKWELIICDRLGNKAYFTLYIVTHAQNGFAYTTPYEYQITEMWFDGGDGVRVSYMAFVTHTDSTSSFSFTENGTYTVVMTSDVTGMTSTFDFTVNTTAPEVSLVGCGNGETTINDITLNGYKLGDVIRIYRETKTGEELVEEVAVTSLSTKIPTVTEGGKYRIVVESEAGVQTELSFVRKHVMNTAGSIFIMVMIGLAVVGLFVGLVYRNKSKTDD